MGYSIVSILQHNIRNATVVILPDNDDGPRAGARILGFPPGRQ